MLNLFLVCMLLTNCKSMKNIVFFASFFLLTIKIQAQIPVGYYDSAQGLQGLPLKLALHNIIKNHTSVSYASLWTHFQTTDAKPNGEVWDIYSDVPNGTPPYTFTFISDQCGTYSNEGDCYNREHSWPQSWFNSATIPSSDMFHIYPTDGKVNNQRANYPYGMVATAALTTLNGGKLGSSASAGYNGTVFEPIDEYKGDLARGYFYMCVRYYLEDTAWSSASNQMCNKSEIDAWGLQQLLAWHHQDTVSTKEIARNNAIYLIQNNRNPFIDNPQWADSVWLPILTNLKKYTSLENTKLLCRYDAVSHQLSLSHPAITPNQCCKMDVLDMQGRDVFTAICNYSSTLQLPELVSGLYALHLQVGKETFVAKLYIP